MSDFLLVHGGSHGAWCWERLISELSGRGHTAFAIDLPGHGADRTPRKLVDRRLYIDAISSALSKRRGEKLTLVGHSLAGGVLPEISRLFPDLIAEVVFLAALVLSEREALIDLIPEERRSIYYQMAESSPDHSFLIAREKAKEIFFSDLPDDQADKFYDMLTPQPFQVYLDRSDAAPQITRIPIRYILCSEDKTLPRALCTDCARKLGIGPSEIEEIPAGHDVMLSRPQELADVLLRRGPAPAGAIGR